MTFFLHESIQPNGHYDLFDHGAGRDACEMGTRREEFPLLRDKLRIPATAGNIERPRLTSLLARSFGQFPATLISGRAGTGKTALAAGLARDAERACWYTVEAADAEWPVFSRYLSVALTDAGFADPDADRPVYDPSLDGIAKFLLRNFFAPNDPKAGSSLIVVDDIHHLFDVPWFAEFFNLLLYSLPAKTHLLLLCRSKPPSPMWRLRSKQMLNVLDEKVIAFTPQETVALFASLGLSRATAELAYRASFGRVSKLLQRAEYFSTILPPSTSAART